MTEKDEILLCFDSGLLSAYSGQKVFYMQFLWDQIQRSLVKLRRSEVEQNLRYKQLVAYNIIKSKDSYLTYKRTEKGGESRLWEKYSLGVGGHINIDDRAQTTLFGPSKNGNMSFFSQAVWREIEEEIVVDSPYSLSKPELKRFINDDSDNVGQVHFGLVWVLEVRQPNGVKPPSELKDKKVIRGKKGLTELEFCDIKTLEAKRFYFETWSQLIIDSIAKGEFS